MEVGDRVMVFHRPARIAYEARIDAGLGEQARRQVQDDIMRVLSADTVS